jgi:GxxExxY protein
MLTDPARINGVTSRIIGSAVSVHRALGPCLLESTYTACLVADLRANGCDVACQVPVSLTYQGTRLDVRYRIDILVQNLVIVEVKAVDAIAPVHRAQILTYLKLGGYPVGLLINFNVPTVKSGIARILNAAMTRRDSDPV